MTTILAHTTIVTGNPERDILYNAAIVINNGCIDSLGPDTEIIPRYPDAEIVDCHGKTIMPGLINAHTHLMKTIGRGILEDTGFPNTLQYPIDIRDILTVDEKQVMIVLGALESIRSGTTCLLEIGRSVTTFAPSLLKTGLRWVLSEHIFDMITKDENDVAYSHCEKTMEQGLQASTDLIEAWTGKGKGRISCFVAPGAPEICSPKLLRNVRAMAEKYETGYTIHLCQSHTEMDAVKLMHGVRPTHYLFANEFLSSRLLTAHNRYVDNSEISMLGHSKVGIANNPSMAAKRGATAPIMELQAAGCTIGMGSDNMSQDMVEVMRSGLFYERIRRNSQMAPMPEDLLEWATLGSAKVLRLNHIVGSLEIGKQADIIIINSSKVHLVPNLRIVSAFVHNGQAGDVESVMVAGDWVMRNGKVLTIDEDTIVQMSHKIGHDAWNRLLERYPNVPFPFSLDQNR